MISGRRKRLSRKLLTTPVPGRSMVGAPSKREAFFAWTVRLAAELCEGAFQTKTVSEVSGLTLIIPGTRSGWCDMERLFLRTRYLGIAIETATETTTEIVRDIILR